MAYDQQTGTADLRTEVVDKVIRDIAKPSYKFKQVVRIVKTNAWKQTFFRASTTVLTGKSGSSVEGIPRGAAFPRATPTSEEVNSYIKKYGLEDYITFEDVESSEIDQVKQIIFKLTQAVVSAVDGAIYTVLSEGGTISDTQSITITGGRSWNNASAAIIDNLMNAKQLIGVANYDTTNLTALISERDHRSIVNWLAEKGSQFPTVGTEMAKNGKVGKIAGIDLVVSNNVTASRALIVVPKVCGAWRESISLRSDLKKDAFKGTRIRVVEMGVCQMTDPSAVVQIIGTQQTT